MAVSLPTDGLFSQQWFLHNTVTGQYDLDVVSVWADYTGKGVKVMVMDNGFDHDHVDLEPNYDVADSYDYGAGDSDAAPDDNDAGNGNTDDHGTSVMGIIGAARNGVGVVGVAYESTLVGASIRYEDTADDWATKFVKALGDAVTEGVGVVNMSFGGAADYDAYDGPTNIANEIAAVKDAVDNGRDGLGIVIVKSAGNSRSDNIDVNHNQNDNNSNQVIVAAVNNDGFVSNYSSYGTPILISAFGSPSGAHGGGASIVTTDRTGDPGYSNNSAAYPDYELTFNGTSAAAPQVSGIVALMLQANPGLGWRDVQTILADTARHVGSPVDGVTIANGTDTRFEQHAWNWNTATDWNGGAMHYNEDYGYGLVDARAAVRLAESWNEVSTSESQKSASLKLLDTSTPILDDDTTGSTFTHTMTKSIDVERVTVSMAIQSDNIPDIAVYLTGPDGIKYALSVNQDDGYDGAYDGTFTYHSQAYRGMLSKGDWSVQVVDNRAGNITTISNIAVKAYGSAPSADDTYVYTDEFSDFAGHRHSKNLRDTDGGVDTLNAAAVSSGSVIDLSRRTGTVDGVAMRISGIDNVDGGDGKDALTGNSGANILSGGRGGDALAGGGGADVFLYHTVADSLDGKQHDVISDFVKGDRIDLADIDTKAKAGDQGFIFVGQHPFSDKAAQLDFELVDKKGTTHDQTFVYADVDGDGTADFEIQLNGLHTLTKHDLVL